MSDNHYEVDSFDISQTGQDEFRSMTKRMNGRWDEGWRLAHTLAYAAGTGGAAGRYVLIWERRREGASD